MLFVRTVLILHIGKDIKWPNLSPPPPLGKWYEKSKKDKRGMEERENKWKEGIEGKKIT